MFNQNGQFLAHKAHHLIRALPIILVILSLACSLPTLGRPTETQPAPTLTSTTPPTPTPTPQPLPPDLVESDPPQNVEMPLEGPITLYFNQPMDHGSVEAALSSQFNQQITFTWTDDSTVILYLSEPLEPEAQLSFDLNPNIRSAQGLGMIQPISLNYQATGYLLLTHNLPEDGANEVDPSSAIVATFNRPVVPLGADPASLPVGFTIEPGAQGRGEWINTSTYVFYPEPALHGGLGYSIAINPKLQSVDGGPLQEVRTWSFTTAIPRLASIEPETEIPWDLDAEIVLTFNQPMDPVSVEANFGIAAPDGGLVSGVGAWEEENTVFTFTPDNLLARGADYTIRINGQAQANGGTPLGENLEVSVVTVPPLTVRRTEPEDGGQLEPGGNLALYMSAPLKDEDVSEFIEVTPQVSDLSTWWNFEAWSLHLNGAFAPSTSYTITVSPDLTDAWGAALGEEYQFTFYNAPLRPNLIVNTASEAIFMTPQDTSLVVQAANLSSLPMSVGSVSLNDFINMLAPGGYEFRQSYQSSDQATWDQPLDLEPDRMQTVEPFLSPDQSPLESGLYIMRFNFPEESRIHNGPFLIVVSDLQVTYKTSATDALVWVVDLRNGAPLSNAPVTLYAEDGSPLASGQTDVEGVFQAPIPEQENPYSLTYAVVGQPGAEPFGMALSSWSQGVQPWEFGIDSYPQSPELKVYFYSDRPIYRSGQTVYFRAIARQAYNGRYNLPDIASLPVSILGPEGAELASFDLPLSTYGAAHGEYPLSPDAPPGYYSINSPAANGGDLNFQVASYRKPEINLQVDFTPEQAQAGQKLTANVNARYYFDAPAGNLPLHWALYATDFHFSLPGYQVGPLDTGWLDAFRIPSFQDPLGILIDEGDAETAPDGTRTLEFPTKLEESRMRYTLEVTIEDESGLPVSARNSAFVNPGEFYIGVRPDAWVSRAAEQAGFEVQVVDWEKASAGVRNLRAEFQNVVWEREEPPPGEDYAGPTFTPQYTMIGSTDFTTDELGNARLAFTPPEPGTYQLDVFNPGQAEEEGPRTQALLWVGGAGQAIWPNLPNSRLRMTADKESYLPGESAQIFIPNPFGDDVPALVTLERGTLIRHQVLKIPAGGYELSLPLSSEEAPNVQISTTLVGKDADNAPDFRQGYLNIPVEPIEQTLNVALTSQPQRAGPGDEVTLEVQVTDSQGAPVQGEFSLAVVDLAVLALADPNSVDIVSAFYSQQPNGVQTGLSLAAYNRRLMNLPMGMGGGGGDIVAPIVRERFPDTAYWNAEIVTDADGKAQVNLPLPDTLTTWQVESRGLTSDTRVGQDQDQIVTSKDLLVRPVTPRFLVANDHALLATVVQNNTDNPMQVEVSLQANGLILDDAAAETQIVEAPPQGRARVEWWGVVQDLPSVELIFSANGKDDSGISYQDAARPALGALPVLKFLAPHTFRTSGTMDVGGEIMELVSLPRSYIPDSGELDVELSPSLFAAMIRALDVLEDHPYDSTERIVSGFLSNLETFQTLQSFDLGDPSLETRLDRTLNTNLGHLVARQNQDGGWGWWQGGESDPYITSYVLLGLSRARLAGININLDMIRQAVDYLQAASETQAAVGSETWQLDRQVFQQFVLAELGEDVRTEVATSYQARDQLSPWAQALLALALERLSPGSSDARALLSELETSAIRSATGAYWELSQDPAGLLASYRNMQTTLSNSAIVTYALAQRDPGSPLAADAVRYLMAHRDAEGAWNATYTTAWTLIALNEVVKGTGELGGDFTFSASVNGNLIAEGRAGGVEQITPVTAQMPAERLYSDNPNALVIERDSGQGRLYYAAALNVGRPVEEIAPLSQGLSIERAYYPAESDCSKQECEPIQSANAGERVQERLTLTLPQDAYFLAVEDYIPAGSEILDLSLKTTQIGDGGGAEAISIYDPRRPFAQGWGWWLFNPAQIYDDHIAWTAEYLPAGTYELTYTLTPSQPGEYHVLPARAWQLYFPEVQANSAGELFEIKP